MTKATHERKLLIQLMVSKGESPWWKSKGMVAGTAKAGDKEKESILEMAGVLKSQSLPLGTFILQQKHTF